MAVPGAVVSVLVWNWLKDADTRAQGARTKKAKPKEWSKIIRVMAPVAFILATRAMMVAVLSTYFPSFLLEQGASTFLSGAGLTLIFISGVVGSFMAGSLSDRFSRLGILGIATIAQTAFMLLFLQTKGWLQIPVLVLIGFFEVAVIPVFMAYVQEGFREDRAFINGLYLSLNFVSSALAVPLVGRLADMFNFRTAFLVASYVLPLGLLGLAWMRLTTSKKTKV
jgi:FSR family fosmidomycin resistance protein-like MFS transporter